MTSPRTILRSLNAHASRKLGQNFLTDQSIPRLIIEKSGITSKDIILEIGAGLGALTIPVAKVVSKLYAIEKDTRLIDALKRELSVNDIDNVIIHNKDILKLEISEFPGPAPVPEPEPGYEKIIVMGNLPYNISSQILVKLIHSRSYVQKAIFMFQKELAQRIMADPGTRQYGRLAAMLNYCAAIKPLLTVKPASFFPKPGVDSQVIEIEFFKENPYKIQDELFLFSVIKAAFGQRRKTLKNSLTGSFLKIDKDNILSALKESEIDPVRRAETLSVDNFVRLSNNLYKNLPDYL